MAERRWASFTGLASVAVKGPPRKAPAQAKVWHCTLLASAALTLVVTGIAAQAPSKPTSKVAIAYFKFLMCISSRRFQASGPQYSAPRRQRLTFRWSTRVWRSSVIFCAPGAARAAEALRHARAQMEILHFLRARLKIE